jgi:hypothetical protein
MRNWDLWLGRNKNDRRRVSAKRLEKSGPNMEKGEGSRKERWGLLETHFILDRPCLIFE